MQSGTPYTPHTLFYWLICIIGMALVTCSSSTDAMEEVNLEGQWQPAGLADTAITVLQPDGEGLLVGTEQGLFKWKAGEVINLGLNDREIRGVVRLKGNGLLAGATGNRTDFGDTTLFRSQNNGVSWEPFLNNFGGESKATWIQNGPVEARPFSDTLFVQGISRNIVVRSGDAGQSWELVLGQWNNSGGSGELLYMDRWHPGRIWAGGVTSLSQPSLLKSNDYGDKWEELASSLRGPETVAYDVMTHREDPDQVLVGFSAFFASANNVRKSTDGGQSWRVVLEETGVLAFAHSLQNSHVIYASGRDSSTRLFFAATADFGETWQKKIFAEGPSVVTTNDLAVLTVDGKEVLFLGTDQGLFSFRFEE